MTTNHEIQVRVDFRPVVFRMSRDVAAMIDFLTVLGLRQQVSANRRVDGRTPYATAVGRTGKVAVHLAHDEESVGRSELTFDVDDGDAAVAVLTEARIGYRRHDEAFGRVVTAITEAGEVWIGEDNRDDHGYTVHDTAGVGPVDVVAVRFTDDPARDRALWATFGIEEDGPIHLNDGVVSSPRPAVPVGLALDTDADLDDLATRLVTAGYADAVVRDEAGVRVLHVTDPDGEELQVWPTG